MDQCQHPFERVLFGLVANRALAPSSKLAAADWITHDVHIDGLLETSDDVCYRAMNWLHAVTFTGPTGTFRQRTDPTKSQIDLYARLDLPLPKKIIEVTAAGR